MDNSDSVKSQRTILLGLTLALLAWGGYHAIGSFFGGFGGENLQHDFRRSLVVFGCMAAFLSFWWVLLLSRSKSRRSAASARTEDLRAAKKEDSSSAAGV